MSSCIDLFIKGNLPLIGGEAAGRPRRGGRRLRRHRHRLGVAAAPRATPATSSARGQGELPALCRSSASSSTRYGARRAGLRADRVPARRARRRSTPASRCRRSSRTSTSPPSRATTSTARGRPTTNHQSNLFTSAPTRRARASRDDAVVARASAAAPGAGAGRRRAVLLARLDRSGCRRTTACTRPSTGAGAGHLGGRHRGLQGGEARYSAAATPDTRTCERRRAVAVRRHDLLDVRRPAS